MALSSHYVHGRNLQVSHKMLRVQTCEPEPFIQQCETLPVCRRDCSLALGAPGTKLEAIGAAEQKCPACETSYSELAFTKDL